MTEQKAKQQPGVEEVWMYIGRRLLQGGTLGYFWLDQDGKEAGFKKGPHRHVGSTYKVRVTQDDGRSNIYTGYTKFNEPPAKDDGRVAEWRFADTAAYNADELRKAEQRVQRDTSVWDDMTLAEFREHFSKLPGGQRNAMQAWLTGYMWSH